MEPESRKLVPSAFPGIELELADIIPWLADAADIDDEFEGWAEQGQWPED